MSEQNQQTLIEKLERESDRLHKLSVDFSYDTRLRLINEALGIYRAINIIKKHNQETCNWRDNRGTALWECHYGGDYTSDCGLEWNMSNKDSPSENGIHFCPKCGRKLVETKPPSEVQDD